MDEFLFDSDEEDYDSFNDILKSFLTKRFTITETVLITPAEKILSVICSPGPSLIDRSSFIFTSYLASILAAFREAWLADINHEVDLV